MFELLNQLLFVIQNNLTVFLCALTLIIILSALVNRSNLILVYFIASYNPILFIIVNSIGFERMIFRVVLGLSVLTLSFIYILFTRKKIIVPVNFLKFSIPILVIPILSALLFENSLVEISVFIFLWLEIFAANILILNTIRDKIEYDTIIKRLCNYVLFITVINLVLYGILNKTFYFKATILGTDLGRYTDFIIPTFLIYLIFAHKKSVMSSMKILILTIPIFLGFFRSIWISVVFTIIYLFYRRGMSLTELRKYSLLGLILVLGSIFLFPSLVDSVFDRLFGQGLSETSSIDGRVISSLIILKEAFSFPYVFIGHGLGSDFLQFGKIWPISSSSNLFIGLFHQIGLLLFLYIFFVFYKFYNKNLKPSILRSSILIMNFIVFIFFPAVFHFPILFAITIFFNESLFRQTYGVT